MVTFLHSTEQEFSNALTHIIVNCFYRGVHTWMNILSLGLFDEENKQDIERWDRKINIYIYLPKSKEIMKSDIVSNSE